MNAPDSPMGRLAARWLGAGLVLHEHFADPRMPRYQGWADRALRRLTHRAIAVSGSTRDFLVRERHVPAQRVRVIWNGAPLDEFAPVPREQALAVTEAAPELVLGWYNLGLIERRRGRLLLFLVVVPVAVHVARGADRPAAVVIAPFADQRRVELLPGQQADEQAHRRARIAQIERGTRRLQRKQAATAHTNRLFALLLDAHAHAAQCLKGTKTVLALQETFDFGQTLGDGTQQQCPMGDRLVARHGDVAGQRPGGGQTQRGGISNGVAHDAPL